MIYIKVGDKVRVTERKDWPSPPGYRFNNSEGTVVSWTNYDEVMQNFQNYVFVKIEKSNAEEYLGKCIFFHQENLKKI